MKQLLERIVGVEQTLMAVIKNISSLKEENKILYQENNRLLKELNQLRERSGIETDQVSSVDHKRNSSESDIAIGQIKQELDRCIEEIHDCLGQM